MNPNVHELRTNFHVLFAEHVDFVWRVLKRHGVPERELEDACQEVFLVVHRRLPEFEGRSSMRTWVYGIAARVALGHRRKAHLRREVLDIEESEHTSGTSLVTAFDLASQKQVLELAAEALTRMDDDKREVFALYELEGLTMAEVAASLDVPESTALSRLYAAREEIQRFVQKVQAAQQRRAYAKRSAG
ncbi:MAG: RNA polymerase sigma factor [Myxococcales bacterium]